MFNPEKLEREYNKLADGKPKLTGIKMAIQEADNNKAYHWSLYFREEYIQESVFEDDTFNAIIMFPEYMALYDEHPELHDRHKHTFMIRFKWIVENLSDFYQVSKEQVDRYFYEFKRRCNEYGYSLRSYYMKRTEFYKYVDTEIAKEDFENYKKSKRDSISDCYACDTNKQVTFELDFGNIETALNTAKPILNGSQRCAEVPQATYGALMFGLTKLGQFDEAMHYGNLMYKMVEGDTTFLQEIGKLLILCSITDLDMGYKIFNKHSSILMNSKNPMNNLYFSMGAYRLFKAILEDGCNELSLKRLSKKYPIYEESGIYNTQTLVDYFYDYSKDLATKFDNRNGTSYFMDLLSFKYELSNNTIKLPKHITTINRELSVISIPLREDIEILQFKDTLKENLKSMNIKLTSMEVVDENPDNTAIGIVLEYQDVEYSIMLEVVDIKIPDETTTFKHSILKKDYQETLEHFKYSLLCVTEFNDQIGISYHVQLKVLCALGLESAYIYDFSRNTILSYKWAELCAYSNVQPSVDYLVNVEIVSDDESDTAWLYTRGLSYCGIKELEIIGAKKDFIDNYYQMLMVTAENILYYGKSFDENDTICYVYNKIDQSEIRITWQSTEDALKDIPLDTFGSSEKRYSDMPDTACIKVFATRKSKKSYFIWELSDELVSNILCPYTYTKINLDTQLAIERLPFIEKLLKSDLDCTIKVSLELDASNFMNFDESIDEDDDYDYYDDFELVTIELESLNQTEIVGSLLHDVENFGYQKGDTIKAKPSDLTNWLITFEDGINITPDNIYMIL